MDNEAIAAAHGPIAELRAEIGRTVIGQHALVDRILIALFIRGHVLLEGLPGLAKTLVVKTLAAAIEASFKRVQFTPDLLPADVTGTLIFDPAGRTFNPRFGPIFANLVLADEVNRAPAKVQSALLEAMQERQVTIGDTSYKLPDPFVVIATQNPIEQEGTYALPEAQLDRFAMKVLVSYPSRDEELEMLKLHVDEPSTASPLQARMSTEKIREISGLISTIHLDDRLSRYLVDIVSATRNPSSFRLEPLSQHIAYGASPRATLALASVARGAALLDGRSFVIPEDVKAVAHDVLRHRLILTYEAAAEQISPDQIIDQVLGAVRVP